MNDAREGVAGLFTYYCHERRKERTRCMRCGKIAYVSEEAARNAADKITERVAMKVYRGACGHWHLSRKRWA